MWGKVRKGETKISKMATNEVVFTKKDIFFDERSDEQDGGSVLQLDTIPRHSAERIPSIMEGDAYSKKCKADKTNLIILVK